MNNEQSILRDKLNIIYANLYPENHKRSLKEILEDNTKERYHIFEPENSLLRGQFSPN